MIVGSLKKIDLGTQSFEQIRSDDALYVDKSRFIEHVLTNASRVLLVARHRRLGKSLNMDMLCCFLTDRQDYRGLFRGLYIENSSVWHKAHTRPVLYFDLKTVDEEDYKMRIYDIVCDHMAEYVEPDQLSMRDRELYDNYLASRGEDAEGILLLTRLVYNTTGIKPYLLIDEYDRLMTKQYRSAQYEQIRHYITKMITSAVKGNPYLDQALLTGVMRVSKESMFSGLNNIEVFDVFSDDVFTDDYGLTDQEVDELSQYAVEGDQPALDKAMLKQWYNGFTIDGHAIYNIYSTMSFMKKRKYDCYWGKSGTIDMVLDLLNDRRRITIEELINGDEVKVPLESPISLKYLTPDRGDEEFYSLLVQAGYLTVTDYDEKFDEYTLHIPNKELEIVWRKIINTLHQDHKTTCLRDDSDTLEWIER
jgi:hypothetical protein